MYIIVPILLGIMLLLVVIILGNSGSSLRGTQQYSANGEKIIVAHGHAEGFCPWFLKENPKCMRITTPANGQWIRFLTPSYPHIYVSVTGVQARGCSGELYDFSADMHYFNSSCGYLDYRSSDGMQHNVWYGISF